VVPLADPPVGTRGRPLGDRLFSGLVGRSQFPAFLAVLENGRRGTELTFSWSFGLCKDQGARKAAVDRETDEHIEMFPNREVTLDILRVLIVVAGLVIVKISR
jgi:hypothetical protein